jgi:ethanolamine ammonia-lyase small subunit
VTPDPWIQLRKHTTARIALGRAGGSLPTAELLAFAMDHADARDAVYSELDVAAMVDSLAPLKLPAIVMTSQATDRQTYLKRPDLGRRLDAAGAEILSKYARRNTPAGVDIAIIIADGLSALAAQRHAPAVLGHLVPLLQNLGLTFGPICIVTQARVAIQDEIGALLRARLAIILIGERPGLGSADSLGAYLVYNPKMGNSDAQRNCVSNIRPGQLHPMAAAETLAWLITQSLARSISGIQLKDDRQPREALGSKRDSLPG